MLELTDFDVKYFDTVTELSVALSTYNSYNSTNVPCINAFVENAKQISEKQIYS